MKQRTKGTGGEKLKEFSEEEIEVCEIILNLPKLVSGKFSFTWGRKRRRSVLDSKTPAPPPPPFRNHQESSVADKVKEIKATSPSTPLSFSPSGSDDSDDKSKQHSSKKISNKRTREEWMEMIEGLTQHRELLRGEVEIVRSNYQKLIALNLQLKAKKQEVTCPQLAENSSHLQIINKKSYHTIGMNFTDPQYQIPLFAPAPQHQIIKIQETILDKSVNLHDPLCQRAQPMVPSPPHLRFNFNHLNTKTSSNNNTTGFGPVNQICPRGIPDLNISAEETFGLAPSQPLDLNRVILMENRVRAAEARKRRMMKIKENKNSSSSSLSSIKHPRCR